MSEKCIVIAAAGTGGHVMPGIAVAKVLQSRGWRLHWVGTTTGMERGLVEKQAIDFDALNFQGVRGKGLLGAVKGGVKLLAAFFQARSILKRLRPKAVFSTGGYIAVPVGWAAKRLGIPLVLMNCDADLLMSTNTLLPISKALACGFAGGARSFAGSKGVVTGNPVRESILAIPPVQERWAGREGVLKLFVFGGSLGAKVINDVLPEALALIPEASRPMVVHQTGKNRDDEVRAHYERLGVKADVRPFIDDMAHEYSQCDVVLSRSGATSVSELCAAGVPAILVPFVAKTTSHQRGNARYMQSQGAAIVVEQSDFTPEYVKTLLSGLTREKLSEMATRARELAKPKAAEEVANLVEKWANI